MQTPQGGLRDVLAQAHLQASEEHTDELALVDAAGLPYEIVPGDPENFKITTPDDLKRAEAMLGPIETRTGLGYDIHAFSRDAGRRLMLGGVFFEEELALEGHSDADVILHAAVDALLGAAALGDIGQHFSNTDPQWKGEPSVTFLKHAGALLHAGGWRIVNLDVAVMAERPKIMPRALEMRQAIGAALDMDVDRVSIKATTNEGLGAIGRGEGIAAYATATIARP
jgi:2-C-methyl-D-erythritol 4-phosphate cytidylyltransferase/2-C-methyl-D-erythritol 2,4-cyclodiphosphate synthase